VVPPCQSETPILRDLADRYAIAASSSSGSASRIEPGNVAD